MLGQQPDLEVVALAQLARVEVALPGERGDQRRLARAVGADERHVLAALEPELELVEQLPLPDPQLPVLDLEDHAAGPLGRLEGEAQRLAVARVARDPVHLVELLLARLGLAGAGAGAEARDEALQRGDLGLLLLDRATQRELARRLLLAPRVPGALEVARAAALELQHRGADRLEEPAVVRHEHDRRVERLQVRLQPLERGDVEVVGRLVEQEQVGIARERAGQRRAGELPAGERGELPVQVLVAEAEAVEGRVDALAPVVAAGVLQAGLRARVRVHHGEVALGHLLLQLAQAGLEREEVAAAAEHVVAQGEVAVARRALVVELHADVLGEHELPAVHRRLPREHPQQRRLARAVAARERQPVAALELEGDAPEQGRARHVLGEVRCDRD